MTEKKKGRPPIEIDQEQFEKLCEIQCTLEEIANVLKCSMDTVAEANDVLLEQEQK